MTQIFTDEQSEVTVSEKFLYKIMVENCDLKDENKELIHRLDKLIALNEELEKENTRLAERADELTTLNEDLEKDNKAVSACFEGIKKCNIALREALSQEADTNKQYKATLEKLYNVCGATLGLDYDGDIA